MNKPIVIVDDDEDDRLFIKEAFIAAKCKCPVIEFDKGMPFVEYILQRTAAQLPAMVMIDYNLPPLNAAEVLRNISLGSNTPHFPLIVFTTAISPQAKQEILKAGASLVINKPAEPGQLKKIVEAIMLLWVL